MQENQSPVVLVLGASGFVGRNALRSFSESPVRVIAGCRDPSRLSPDFDGEVRVGDLRDAGYLQRVFQGVNVVCMASAWSALYGHAEHSRALFFEPTRAALRAAAAAKVSRVVLTGALNAKNVTSCRYSAIRERLPEVWPHLANALRLEAEMEQLSSDGPEMVSLRFGTFAGQGCNLGVLPVLLPQLQRRLVPWIDGGTSEMPLIDGRDIGRAFAAAALAPGLGPIERVEVVGPSVPTFRQVLTFLNEEFGYPLPVFSVSTALAYRFAHVAELMSRVTPWDPLLTRSIVFLSESTSVDGSAQSIGFVPQVPWQEAVVAQVRELRASRKGGRMVDRLPPRAAHALETR